MNYNIPIFFENVCGIINGAEIMLLPNEFIEAQEMIKKARRLASEGFEQMIHDALPESAAVSSFAKMIEAFCTIEAEFGAMTPEQAVDDLAVS